MKNFKITIFIVLTLCLYQHIDSMHEAEGKSNEISGKEQKNPGLKKQEPSVGQKNLMNKDSSVNKDNNSQIATKNQEADPGKNKINMTVDMTMDMLNIPQDSLSGPTQARLYDPYDVTKSDPNGPIMTKNILSDGSEIRTYFDHDNNPISTNIVKSPNPKTNGDINYNLDGTISHLYDGPNGRTTVKYKNRDEFKQAFNKKTSTVDNTQNKINTTTDTNLFPSPKAEKAPSIKSTDSTTQSNKQVSTKAPDDIRAKADQFNKLDNYTGDINTPIIDMYKKPGETVTETNNSITHDNSGEIFNYKSTLSDGTSVHTQLRPGESGPKLMSTDVTNSSGRTNVKYNTDGSKTEIFTPKDGSAQRTVTYNNDGSVKLQDENGTKEFTKDEAAAKKTGISGKINWLKKRSTEAYQSLTKSSTVNDVPQSASLASAQPTPASRTTPKAKLF